MDIYAAFPTLSAVYTPALRATWEPYGPAAQGSDAVVSVLWKWIITGAGVAMATEERRKREKQEKNFFPALSKHHHQVIKSGGRSLFYQPIRKHERVTTIMLG